jgi:hypothetical protein
LSRSTAGPDGTYRAEAPGEGTYVLIASADGHQPQAKTVVVGASPVTHDVLLTGSSGLAGVVRSADGGIPVAGGTGTLTATEGAPLLTLETDAEHLDRLEGVMGRHLVRFGTRDELVVEWRRDAGEVGSTQRGEPA